jgi:hypothetical protein
MVDMPGKTAIEHADSLVLLPPGKHQISSSPIFVAAFPIVLLIRGWGSGREETTS